MSKELGYRWMFAILSSTDSMNYIPVSLANQTNHAGTLEVTNHAGLSEVTPNACSPSTPNVQASEDDDEAAELMVVPTAIKFTAAKVGTKKPSIDSKEEACLTELQSLKAQKKRASPAEPSEVVPDILTFRRELEAIAHKHLGAVPDNNITSTPLIHTGSGAVNTGKVDATQQDAQDDSDMPELEIFHKPQDGIFDKASYDAEGVVHNFNNLPMEVAVSPTPTLRIHNIHPQSQILSDPKSSVQTQSKVKIHSRAHALMSYIQEQQRNNHKDQQHCLFACFLSQEEPKKVADALQDSSWVEAMQEELLQFKLQQVWVLVDLPHGVKVIGTKWVFRNKKDERGVVIRNKARLVAQGYKQEEGVDYDEVFAPMASIKAIRLFLAFASFMGIIVYQMDVKSAFLYVTRPGSLFRCNPFWGCYNVAQPPGFVDPDHPTKVYKVVKALYGLHQASRAWYATLSTFLEEHGYRRRAINKTLFIKKDKKDIMFQISSMGELTFFLGLQVKQKPDGLFISQDKYVAEMLKKFDLASVKTVITPIETKVPLTKDEVVADVDVHLYRSMIGSLMYLTASRPDIMFAVCACSRFQVTPKTLHLHAVKRIFKYLKGKPNLGLWYPRDSPLDLEAYSDSDYAGANLDRKSTTGGVVDSKSNVGLMASLKYCDKHNQVGFLKKPEESLGFAEIVDFLRSSHLRYALTHNPTVYDSLVKQFWQTATASTLADRTLELRATIDTIEYTITEASIRSKLQLADASGISMLPNTEIFEGMGNMGPKSGGWDQFGSNIATALICLSTGRIYNFSKLIFDGMVANLKSKTKFLMYPRFLQMVLEINTENKHPYLSIAFTKKIFGNMKRDFRGIPRPLLPVMLPIVNQSAGQEGLSAIPPPSTSPPAIHPEPTPLLAPTLTPTPTPVQSPTPV
ncbi:putative ribonuclease H-like domain-containing protein [Tanacetum coccineum]|uniref:Ribonuclease H-like domain-containing protein n=1 Tax=Tanacetum coccineum TaxID=301880 RepID=A0ABQ4X0Z4_9ASTR